MPMKRALAVTLALWAIVLALSIARNAPPTPAPPDAPLDRFSAGRAREIQRALAEVGPRPIGSEGNAKGRAILLRELARSGWKAEERRGFACGRHGSCGFVRNIVATRAGREPHAAAVMLSAHHDSVPSSPGASDDGAGAAAVVEAARALGASPPTRRPLVVVLTDGEEAGLLGAEAFRNEMAAHELGRAEKIRGVVNLDARGSSGPSAMFETSGDNAWLIALAAERLDHPVTSSLFYEVYQRMPNDTDFTVSKQFAKGVNFANTGGIEHYHTPLDSLAHADIGTLQHHGEQALAMTRALAEADLDAAPRGDAAWFSVLALGIVRWPLSWSVPLACVALGLIVVQAFKLRAWGLGLLVAPASLAASVAATLALGFVLRTLGALPTPWVAHPLPAVLSLHLASISAGAAASAAFARRSNPRALFAGVWIAWGLLAVVSANVAPGASYMFTVPVLFAAFFAWLPFEIACALPSVVAAVLLMPLVTPLYDALGFAMPALLAIPTTALVTTLAPLLPGTSPKQAAMPMAAALALAIAAAAMPSFSEQHPQRVNVVFVQDAAGARALVQASWGPARWGKPPVSMVHALGAEVHDDAPVPWLLGGPVAAVPRVDAPAPEITHAASEPVGAGRRVHVTLRSRRDAPTLVLALPSAASRVIVHGTNAVPRPALSGAGSHLGLVPVYGVPSEGVDAELYLEGTDPVDLTLYDVTQGVPPGSPAEAAADARSREATPSQGGDLTILAAHDML